MNALKIRIVSYIVVGIVGGTAAVEASGCAQAAKTAADAAAGVKCVAANWGKPVVEVAAACFNEEEQLALDAVADAEALIQSNGGAPTKAYLADARVQQKVMAKRAGTGPYGGVPSRDAAPDQGVPLPDARN